MRDYLLQALQGGGRPYGNGSLRPAAATLHGLNSSRNSAKAALLEDSHALAAAARCAADALGELAAAGDDEAAAQAQTAPGECDPNLYFRCRKKILKIYIILI